MLLQSPRKKHIKGPEKPWKATFSVLCAPCVELGRRTEIHVMCGMDLSVVIVPMVDLFTFVAVFRWSLRWVVTMCCRVRDSRVPTVFVLLYFLGIGDSVNVC